jgi:hypothetical protein
MRNRGGDVRQYRRWETDGQGIEMRQTADVLIWLCGPHRRLQKIYDSEINIRISWLWDGGIEVWLGDEMTGFPAQETVGSAAEIAPWLQEAIAHFYPESAYSASLDPDVRQRAATRLFLPPTARARVVCPHCGAPHHAVPPGSSSSVCVAAGGWKGRR